MKEEVVPVIGPWEDKWTRHINAFTGSDPDISSRNLQMWGGHENKLWGTTADLMGAKVGNLDITGNREGTTRRRQRLVYIDLTGEAVVHT